jgi:hypothetical protein
MEFEGTPTAEEKANGADFDSELGALVGKKALHMSENGWMNVTECPALTWPMNKTCKTHMKKGDRTFTTDVPDGTKYIRFAINYGTESGGEACKSLVADRRKAAAKAMKEEEDWKVKKTEEDEKRIKASCVKGETYTYMECKFCEDTHYNDEAGGGPCKVRKTTCPKGQWMNKNDLTLAQDYECKKCSAETYSVDTNGDVQCAEWKDACPVGQGWEEGNAFKDASCVPCKAGTFKSIDDGSKCLPFSKTKNQDCPAGEKLVPGNATKDGACTECEDGTFRKEDDAQCTPHLAHCPKGFALPDAGSKTEDKTCEACATGKFKDWGGPDTKTQSQKCVPMQLCTGTGEIVNQAKSDKVKDKTGDRVCACEEGYRMKEGKKQHVAHKEHPTQTCEHINHCSDGTDTCDSKADCSFDGPGKFKCACVTGFFAPQSDEYEFDGKKETVRTKQGGHRKGTDVKIKREGGAFTVMKQQTAGCKAHLSQCPAGKTLDLAGDAMTDHSCEACAAHTWKSATDNSTCLAVNYKCEKGKDARCPNGNEPGRNPVDKTCTDKTAPLVCTACPDTHVKVADGSGRCVKRKSGKDCGVGEEIEHERYADKKPNAWTKSTCVACPLIPKSAGSTVKVPTFKDSVRDGLCSDKSKATCDKGQKLRRYSSVDQDSKCVDCPEGKFISADAHTQETCTQMKTAETCAAGTSYLKPTGTGNFEDASCPACKEGFFNTLAEAKAGGACKTLEKTCAAGKYIYAKQCGDDKEHYTVSADCKLGTAAKPDGVQPRLCGECPDGKYKITVSTGWKEDAMLADANKCVAHTSTKDACKAKDANVPNWLTPTCEGGAADPKCKKKDYTCKPDNAANSVTFAKAACTAACSSHEDGGGALFLENQWGQDANNANSDLGKALKDVTAADLQSVAESWIFKSVPTVPRSLYNTNTANKHGFYCTCDCMGNKKLTMNINNHLPRHFDYDIWFDIYRMKGGKSSPGCVPIKKSQYSCHNVGDPHPRTFNGLYYNYYQYGEFSLQYRQDGDVETRVFVHLYATTISATTGVSMRSGKEICRFRWGNLRCSTQFTNDNEMDAWVASDKWKDKAEVQKMVAGAKAKCGPNKWSWSGDWPESKTYKSPTMAEPIYAAMIGRNKMYMMGQDGTVVYANAWGGGHKHRYYGGPQAVTSGDGHGANGHGDGTGPRLNDAKLHRLNVYMKYYGPRPVGSHEEDSGKYLMYGICQTAGGKGDYDCKNSGCKEIFPDGLANTGAHPQATYMNRRDPPRASIFKKIKFPGVALYAREKSEAVMDFRSHFYCEDDGNTVNDIVQEKYAGVEYASKNRAWSLVELQGRERALQTARRATSFLRGGADDAGDGGNPDKATCALAEKGYKMDDPMYGSAGKQDPTCKDTSCFKANDAWKQLLKKDPKSSTWGDDKNNPMDPKWQVKCKTAAERKAEHQRRQKLAPGADDPLKAQWKDCCPPEVEGGIEQYPCNFKTTMEDAMKQCADCGTGSGLQKDGVNVFDGQTNCEQPDGWDETKVYEGTPNFPDSNFVACYMDVRKTGDTSKLCTVAQEEEAVSCEEYDEDIDETIHNYNQVKESQFAALKAEPEAVAPRVSLCVGTPQFCKEQKNHENLVNLPRKTFDEDEWNVIKVALGDKAPEHTSADSKLHIRFWQKMTDCTCCNDYSIDSLQFLTDETPKSCDKWSVNEPGEAKAPKKKKTKCLKKKVKELGDDSVKDDGGNAGQDEDEPSR